MPMNLKCLFVVVLLSLSQYLHAQVEPNLLFLRVDHTLLPETAASDSISTLSTVGYISSFEQVFKINDDTLRSIYLLKLSNSEYKPLLLSLTETKSWIAYVEEVPKYDFFHTPNDLNSKQWYLQKINAELAWDDFKGDPAIVVAVVDNAIRLDHEDLIPVLWKNSNDIPGNGIDDDLNGYVDDYDGWDAADNDNNPNPPLPLPSNKFNHGTHCAGIVGAKTNNSIGIASLAYNVRIMPVKIGTNSGGSLINSYKGIEYAITNGAKVISMSWGGFAGPYNTEQLMFNYAYRQGIICIAAAGNSNTDAPAYPANYEYVISVGATDENDLKATFSNYGARTDIMAPGVDIWSSTANSTSSYDYMSGTSMATPLVASLAALMLSKDSLLSPEQVEGCIKSTAINIDNLNPAYPGNLGAGRIDAAAALKCVKGIYADFTANMFHVCPGGSVAFSDLTLRNPYNWEWTFDGGSPSTSNAQNPVVTYNSNGLYRVKLKATNSRGSDSIEYNNFIQVGLPTATLSGTYSIPTGYSANLKLDLTGTGPWRVKLNNGTFSYWIDNIPTSVYYFPVTPQNSTNFTIDSVFDANCQGTSSGTAVITIGGVNSGNCSTSTPTFQKRFKASGTDEMHCLISCIDGGYMMIGTTTSIGAGSNDVFAIRTDDTGKVVWAKSYGGTGNERGYSIKVDQTADSGFAITAMTTSFSAQGDDIYFLKLDKSGNIQLQKKYGGSGTEYGRAVLQTQDGSYLVGGTSGSSPKSGAQDAYAIKINTSGDTLWTRKFGFSGPTTNHFISFQELESGNVWMIGHGDHFVTPYVGFLAKVSPDGAILSEKRVYTSIFDAPTASATLKDGNIALIGLNSSNGGSSYTMQVMVMDTSGNIQWSKNLSNGGNIRATGGIATSDSGLVVTSYTNGFGNSDEIVNVKFSSSGAILWSRRFGGSGSEMQDAWSQCITEAPDGGLVFGFNTTSFNSSGKDLMMVKANACGFAGGCYESDVVFTVTNLSMTETNTPSNKNYGTTNVTVNSSVQNWNGILDTSNFCPNQAPSAPGCNISSDFDYSLKCSGESSRFNSLSSSQGNSIVYIKWIFGNGDSLEGYFPSVNYNYAAPGNYNVTLIVGDNGSPACFDTITKQITIVSNLTVKIDVSDTVCSTDTFSLGVKSLVCAIGKSTYHWSPSSYFNDSNSMNPNAALTTSQWLKLTIVDSVGNSASDSVFVFVDGNCCKSYSKWGSPLPVVCPGDSIEFVNQSVAKPSAIYSWDFGLNASPSQYAGKYPPKIYFSPSGSYEVSLIVQDFCGLDTFKRKVYVLDPPSVFIGNDTLLCDNDSISFYLTNVSSYSYNWSPGFLFNDSVSHAPKAWVDTTRNYYLDLVDDWSGCSNKDSMLVELEQMDTLKYSLDTVFCYPNSIVIDYPGSGATGVWQDVPSGFPRIVSDSGTYIIQLNRNGCSTLDTHNIHVLNPNVTLSGPDFLCKSDSGLYTVNRSFSNMLWSTGSIDSFTYFNSDGKLLVTVSEGNCSVSDSIEVERFNTPPFINGHSIVCENDSTELNIIYPGVSILWSTGDTTTNIWVKTGGNYIVDILKNGCVLSDTMLVTTLNIPAFRFPNDTLLCIGDTLLVSGGQWPGANYSWDDGASDTTKYLSKTGSYYLSVGNACGFSTDTINLVFNDCSCISYIPTSFTPNGDGLNELFGPTYCPITEFNMIIFDRWGEIIFETDDINRLWDGTFNGVPVPEGVFGYMINYRDVRGEKVNGKGNVTLLRPKK